MAFIFPRYSELTDSQRTIINLPLHKNHVVTGAPGTGKSVIAIYRASDMCNAGFDVLMLVYNIVPFVFPFCSVKLFMCILYSDLIKK